MSEDTTNNEENTEAVEASEEAAAPAPAPELKLGTVFGFKKGMTAIFKESGERVPVTVLECKPWVVAQLKTQEKDGYSAVQLGFGKKKQTRASKALVGHSKKTGAENGFQFLREVRTDVTEGCELGTEYSINTLEVGTKVKVTSTSKGRGFSGAMKRHGFAGGPASHGSGFHRRPGSIGMCTFPGRVMPGKKMPGQFGNKNITVRGVEVVAVNKDENIVLLKGSVPGAINGLVTIATQA